MKRVGDQTGQILIWTTLLIVTFFAFVALAIDAGFFYQYKRRMQTAADSAAMAGAFELKDPSITQTQLEAAARNDAALNGFTHGSNSIAVTVLRPPTSGFYSGKNGFVEAIITHPHPTYFARIFNVVSSSSNFDTATVRARAVAGTVNSNCVYVLDPNDEKAFEISSGSSITMGCGVQVNSNNAKALSVTSGSSLTATSVNVNGDYESTSGSSVSPAPNTDAPAVPDPLAYIQPPAIPSTCFKTNFELNSQTQTLDPGLYCGGIKLKSGSHATLNPGIYILFGGGLEVLSGSSITGGGVAFYNTAGSKGGTTYSAGRIFIESNTDAQLSAPTTGPLAGILFFQDRSLPESNSSLDASIESDGNTWFHGALYFPNHKLRFHSNSTVSSAAPWTAIVSRLLEVSSNTVASINSNLASSPIPSPLAKAALVE